MSTTAWMFPGQGSQYNGMGKELFSLFPNETNRASEVLGYSIEQLCTGDDQSRLQQTRYTQPAIFFVSCLEFFRRKTFPDIVLGHSLGEWSALVAAGVLDFMDALLLVAKRGELMGQMAQGSMLAVVGKEVEDIPEILLDINLFTVDVANYNSSTQIVLSGLKEDLDAIQLELDKRGFRCIPLSVSGAFHSRYMEQARVEFTKLLIDTNFSAPKIEVISTTTALPLEENYLLETLSFQLTKPVRWTDSIRYLELRGIDSYEEIGPGSVLTKLLSS